MSALRSWRAAFKELDRCPWPGPRPLLDTEDDRRKLIGREADLDEVLAKIIDAPIVILSGASGIGKSSFVNAGLLRKLDDVARFPLVCNAYRSTTDGPERMLFDQLARTRQLDPLGISTFSTGLFAQLEDSLSYRAVIVLDQFEELIRHQAWLVQPVLDLILDASKRYRCRIVLSLRSEYEHRLEPLLDSASPFVVATHRLREISEDHEIEAVLRSGDDADQRAIDDAAVAALATAWHNHRDRSRTLGRETSLLQLQAALYALHARSEGVIGKDDVQRFERTAESSRHAFFDLAIHEAIRRKLERCEIACTAVDDLRSDRPLSVGTRALVRRMAGRLSSGGFKLVQDEADLVLSASHPELDKLRAVDHATSILQALQAVRARGEWRATPGEDGHSASEGETKDVLTASAFSLLEHVGLSAPIPTPDERVRATGLDAEPWSVDPEDVSAGPMLGLPSLAIAVEEIRRSVFALEWLETASLIRSTELPDGRAEVSLIHDGFGDALEEWRRGQHVGPEEAALQLTAARGARFEWRSVGPGGATTEQQNYHLIVNARWRDCEVSASFRGVVFVNCDLRGTRFQRCSFTETVFINCLLDHVTFSECTIEGLPTGEVLGGLSVRSDVDTGNRVDRPRMPSFQLRGDSAAAVAEQHRRYRAGAFPGTSLRSVASGLPALPFDARPSSGRAFTTPTRLGRGGLTIHGGRLNTLTLRGCVFDVRTGGVLTMNDIAGSSLELVEQEQAVIQIKRGLIRGLTITRPVDAPRRAPEPAPRDTNVELLVENSVLANTWIGDGLRGSVRISSSQIWQFWTLSDPAALEVRIEDCLYTGLVNVEEPSDADSEPVRAAAPPFDAQAFLDRSWAMDFRSTPARAEILSE